MPKVINFTFNWFQENTYIIYDETKECIIFDPGCSDKEEEQELSEFIAANELKPVRLINTHCHIDHVLGNQFVVDTYGLQLEVHEQELPLLERVSQQAIMFGLPPFICPPAGRFINNGDIISFGNTQLEAILTPGHSPASLSFYCQSAAFVIVGDVLFQEGIGRTDLPGGDYDTLIKSIQNKLMPLNDATIVYSGHGPATTIGHERHNNPFLI